MAPRFLHRSRQLTLLSSTMKGADPAGSTPATRCAHRSSPRLIVLLMLLLSFFSIQLKAVQGYELPPEFSLSQGASGQELVWSAVAGTPVPVGDARPEFRLPSRVILGYPRERDGKLMLALAPREQELLATGGPDLEVWTANRRIDSGAPTIAQSQVAPEVVSAFRVSSAAAKSATPTAAARVSTPTSTVDPAAPTKYSTARKSYTLKSLNYTGYPVPIEVMAEVTYPTSLQSLSALPLVLFLHGRHATCYREEFDDYYGEGYNSVYLDWPCYSGDKPIPSFQGYRYVADNLASQGNVVVSISANSVNAQDYDVEAGAGARSLLIRHHLALWSGWHTKGGDPWSGIFKGKLDMKNVVLVGHSRGGEGVHRAAVDASSSDPYKIVGLVTYGATTFGRQVTPDVFAANILPTCDGDVSDLQGQQLVDSSRDIAYSTALRSAIIVVGANHNYFNTEWTPGLSKAFSSDDWYDDSDPICGSVAGSVRLTVQEQQVVGVAYTAALVRLAVKKDAAMLPFLDGSYVRPASIGRAEVAVNAVGGAGYRLLFRPEIAGKVQVSKGMEATVCLGYPPYQYSGDMPVCAETTNDDDYYSNYFSYSPHWLTRDYTDYPAPYAVDLKWLSSRGATARFAVDKSMKDLSSHDWIDVRLANDPDQATGARLSLLVRDNQGREATLNTSLTTINGWPSDESNSTNTDDYYSGGSGRDQLDRVHARTLRGSLASVRSTTVNLKNVTDILLIAKSQSGRVYVIDIAASQARIPQPAVLDLPQISVSSIKTKEGNGKKTVKLKITTDRPLKSPGSIWVNQGYDVDGFKVDLPVGGSTNVIREIPITWIGDRLYSEYSQFFVSEIIVNAISGVVTSNYVGFLEIIEDDPPPIVSVASSNVTAIGNSLQWDIKLSSPTTGFGLDCYVVQPYGLKELSTFDVPHSWLREYYYDTIPSKPTPLSELGINIYFRFDYAETMKSLIVPLAPGYVGEKAEWIMIQCSYYLGDYEEYYDRALTMLGKVPASN